MNGNGYIEVSGRGLGRCGFNVGVVFDTMNLFNSCSSVARLLLDTFTVDTSIVNALVSEEYLYAFSIP